MTTYDPIIARSFRRNEQKKIGNCAFIGCLLIAMSIFTVFKPQYLSPLSVLNLQLSSGATGLEDMIKTRDTNTSSLSSTGAAAAGLEDDMLKVRDTNIAPLPTGAAAAGLPDDMLKVRDTNITPLPSGAAAAGLEDDILEARDTNITPLPTGAAAGLVEEMPKDRDTNISPPLEIQAKQIKPLCSLTEPISDFCEIKGQIAINGKSSTIFISSSNMPISPQNTTTSWTIKPYARKGNNGAMDNVRPWTVKLENPKNIPNCTQKHNSPAILFSTGGYSGNHFHAFSDVIVPLYLTSKKFNGEAQFLATDNKWWWTDKFKVIFNKLSRHKIIDIDREEGTHCYQSATIGLKRHKELGIDTSKSPDASMKDFRRFLRTVYSLNRSTVAKIREGSDQNGLIKPRLLIISRGKTRVLTNEDKVVKMAQKSGYEVVSADANASTNLSRFAELVNSCDVLLGVHGAGLTNMVFLPDNAVVIQVVPFGGIDIFAKMDFGDPSKDMNLRYLDYKIKLKESSLIEKYPLDHVAIRDPLSLHKQGWGVLRSFYLDNQDVKLDLRRFRGTLMKALKLLHQ